MRVGEPRIERMDNIPPTPGIKAGDAGGDVCVVTACV